MCCTYFYKNLWENKGKAWILARNIFAKFLYMLLNTCSYFSLILTFQNGMTSWSHFGIKRVEPLNLDSLSVYDAVKLATVVLRLPVIGNTRTEIVLVKRLTGGVSLTRCFSFTCHLFVSQDVPIVLTIVEFFFRNSFACWLWQREIYI